MIRHLTDTGRGDFVYLTGGERAPVEVARMPTLGKVVVSKDSAVTFYPEDGAGTPTMAGWFRKAQIAPQ